MDKGHGSTPGKGTVKSRLIKGFLWNFLALGASRGSALVATIVAARLLGTKSFGELGIIQSTVGMLATFAGMGLGLTGTRYIASLKNSDKAKAGRVLALVHLVGWVSASAMALFLFAFAPWLASETLSNPGIEQGLRIASLFLLFNALTGVQGGTLAGFEAFHGLAMASIAQGVYSIVAIIAGTYYFGVDGAVWGLTTSFILAYALNRYLINQEVKKWSIKIDFAGALEEKKILVKTALPSMLTSAVYMPAVWAGNALLVNSEAGYSQMGIFNAAQQWSLLLAFLPAIMGRVLLPMLASRQAEGNDELESFNIYANWFAVSVVAICLMALTKVVALFYGDKFATESFHHTFVVMLLVSAILSFKEGIARKLVTSDMMWWSFLSNGFWAAAFITSVYFLRAEGTRGMALSYLISNSFNVMVFIPLYLSKKVVSARILFSPKALSVWALTILQAASILAGAPAWVYGVQAAVSSALILRLLLPVFRQLGSLRGGA